MAMKDAEIFNRTSDEILRDIVAAMPAEERLRGLAPEERLAGLSADEIQQLQQYLAQLQNNRH